MKHFIQGLVRSYQAYHADGPQRLKYMGYVGASACLIFYFMRFTRPNPNLYDDAVPRILGFIMFGLLAMPNRGPSWWKRNYINCSYWILFYSLPCFTTLTALQRGGGMPAVSNAFITLFFLILLTDWRNTLTMLLGGGGVAIFWYLATESRPTVPMDLVKQLPAFALILIGGSLFKVSTAQLDLQRKLLAARAMAGSIAHEMRNPLAQLHQHLQAMLALFPPPSTASHARTIGARNADALYSHLAQGEVAIQRGLQVISMTLEEVGAKPPASPGRHCLWAAQTVHRAVSEHGYENEEERLRVTVVVLEDFFFRGDETTCLFVLFNLLGNALAAVAGRPRAGITITVAGHQIRVRDTGPGIAPFRMARLFEPFQTAGKTGGTGLGLAYCQRAMHAVGGSIHCESEEGQYAEFILQFPRLAEVTAQTAPVNGAESARAALAGLHVLVVDDEPLQRRALHRQLQELDLRIDEAASGEQALALMSRQSYDLVILDLHMNGIDGYEAALRVGRGEVPLNQNVCIVAHSAENNLGARMKARKAGMHGFVPKSTAQLPLWQALAGALAQRAATPPLRARPAGCRVLIADDSLPSRRALATSLGQAGMHVVQARHGGEVLVHLQQKSAEAAPFDAVLLDLHMPVLDGMETARAIRQLMPGMRHTPLIAVTACEDAATRSAAREAGIDAFVTKPVELGALLRVLGQGAQVPTLCAPPPAASAGPLLDLPRLQTYKRMNRLDELLDDYLPDIRQLAEKLPACADRADRQQCLELLHSLLGMSGEAGARALYQATRKVYRPLLEEQTWPVQHQWAQDLLRLAQRSEQALRAHAREPEPVQTPN